MDSIFFRVLLNDRIKLEPKFLGKQFTEVITKKLKASVEGVCTKHGFIKDGSVEIYKIAPGSVELVSLNGYILYDVFYYADVCNPLVGSVIKVQVSNVNKFGILAEVYPILEVIIAKNSVNIVSDSSVNLDNIKPGDMLNVEIVGKKYELNDKKISIVGRVVAGATKPGVTSKQGKSIIQKVDEEELEEDVIDDRSSNAEESDENENDSESDDDKTTVNGGDEEFAGEDNDDVDDESVYNNVGGEFFASDEEDFNDGYEFYSDGDGDEDDDDAVSQSGSDI